MSFDRIGNTFDNTIGFDFQSILCVNILHQTFTHTLDPFPQLYHVQTCENLQHSDTCENLLAQTPFTLFFFFFLLQFHTTMCWLHKVTVYHSIQSPKKAEILTLYFIQKDFLVKKCDLKVNLYACCNLNG